MALKIIGAGFGRTGTMSAYHALNQLGFPCYHMIEIMGKRANRPHVDFWLKVARAPAGTQHNWDEVFANYTAALDNPACCVWRELAAAYPEAKIILTVHPKGAEAWYESTMDTIYFTESRWQFKVLKSVVPFLRRFGEMSHKLVWQRAHKGTMDDKAKAMAFYEQHIAEVKASVDPARLLVFSADQGWEPLRKFLDVPIPEAKFPNVNDRATMKKSIGVMIAAAYGLLAGAVLLAAAIIYGVANAVSSPGG
jgi:hypothetical protein